MNEVSIGIPVHDSSAVSQARRESAALARSAGLSEARASDLSIVVTESATNLVKHTPGGTMVLRRFDDAAGEGVEVLALDQGEGMDLVRTMRDGYSTAGSSGSGLGAITRLADEHDIYSAPGLGTVIFARFFVKRHTAQAGNVLIGAICTPYAGERAPGDGWCVRREGSGAVSILVCDGLGHGQFAADASRAAMDAFTGTRERGPSDQLQAVHRAMRPTRGGAVAIARLELYNEVVRFCGVGNISAAVLLPGAQRSMVSHNGTVGHEVRRFEEYAYPLVRGSTVVMHSDGLTARWQLGRYPGVLQRHPAVLAGLLYRDCARGRDDATVVAMRPIEGGGS